MKQAEDRHAELLVRREKRREELERQKSLTLQSVGRMTSALVFPHPDREAPDVRRLCPNLETETTGTILLTPNERRVAGDRHDCYWLYVVTNCAAEATLQEPIKDPAISWDEGKARHSGK